MCTLLKHLLQIMAANRTRKNSRHQLSFTGTSRNVDVGRSCKLCHTHHHQLSTPAEWRNEEARKFVVSLHVQSDALICKRCKDDVTRVLANPSHIPRWRKGGVTGKDKCCITLCSESVFAHGRLGSSEQMQGALEIAGLQVSTDTMPVPTPLCKHHYHLVYNLLQPTQTNCITCGISLRSATPSPRYCMAYLKPELIEKHLIDNTGFEGHIGAQDKVCFTGYKAHLAILHENNSVSTDTDLRQLVSTFSQQIPTTD